MTSAEPANCARPASFDDEFTAALLSAVDPAEAAQFIACITAGRQEACRSARAAWGVEERRSRDAMAAELSIMADDALRLASPSVLPVPAAKREPDRTAAISHTRQAAGTPSYNARAHGIHPRPQWHADPNIDREAG